MTRQFTLSIQVIALTLFTLLAGCSSFNHPQFTAVNVADITQAQNWELQGKIAVRSPSDKFSTNLYWFHQKSTDELRLTTVIGTNLLVLKRSDTGATLEANGETYHDKDPQALLDSMVTIHIPLARLPLWITGQASPQDTVVSHNDDGSIKQLTSNASGTQWQIKFNSWQQQNGTQIPRLITISSEKVQIKIQNNHWQAMQLVTQ
ncbi:lipoprotein insertase outer membrane protein LolB [Shewanella intestini]|uniref:Outer-membrane lipoprotein LolB n=1 Tax=Shewanella intestini TaxID=2017544 RepID=A0ABS5I621_9GAMM|nr:MULTISPECIES: lipoprotein insertase outer membrane protein LolB [Shewanella]MBR9729466.1 outer membrane lipoprotein LolB [Shewanella intestini]MRG35073.1 outer membrane lipoprotein LolB [Shewanella sp. XMDDZSB0408]